MPSNGSISQKVVGSLQGIELSSEIIGNFVFFKNFRMWELINKSADDTGELSDLVLTSILVLKKISRIFDRRDRTSNIKSS